MASKHQSVAILSAMLLAGMTAVAAAQSTSAPDPSKATTGKANSASGHC